MTTTTLAPDINTLQPAIVWTLRNNTLGSIRAFLVVGEFLVIGSGDSRGKPMTYSIFDLGSPLAAQDYALAETDRMQTTGWHIRTSPMEDTISLRRHWFDAVKGQTLSTCYDLDRIITRIISSGRTH